MPQLFVGDPAPWFRGETGGPTSFNFSMAGGRYVCLLFVRSSRDPAAAEALAALHAKRFLFDDTKAAFFGVTPDPADKADPRLAEAVGVRWFFDDEHQIARMYGMADGEAGPSEPKWLVLDPTLRVLAMGPATAFATMLDQLERLPDPELHAGQIPPTPVLMIPRVFEPDFCKALIALYEKQGGFESGFMREIDGKTVAVNDPSHKRRSDVLIDDSNIRDACRARVLRRIVPEIKKVFQFEVTRMERYLIGCYDADQGGHFRAHRDNTTGGTAHRRFAVTLNLNAEDYEGGELRFPEFGRRTYKPPTGGAVVFSCSLLHEATRVTRGRRFAFLPFLYDEAAASIREANNSKLDESIGLYDRGAGEPEPEAQAQA